MTFQLVWGGISSVSPVLAVDSLPPYHLGMDNQPLLCQIWTSIQPPSNKHFELLHKSFYHWPRKKFSFGWLCNYIICHWILVLLFANESTCNVGDAGSIPGSGRSPGDGNGNPLQYSCLENPMDRGAWRAIVHGVTQSQTWLTNTYTLCIIMSGNGEGTDNMIKSNGTIRYLEAASL